MWLCNGEEWLRHLSNICGPGAPRRPVQPRRKERGGFAFSSDLLDFCAERREVQILCKFLQSKGHEWEYPASQPQIGARLETADPVPGIKPLKRCHLQFSREVGSMRLCDIEIIVGEPMCRVDQDLFSCDGF